MRMTSGYIHLREVRFHACHGVMPQEQTVGADFVVSLRIGYDLTAAMQSDDIKDALSYAEAYAIVKREMEVPSALLEHVAGRIADALQQAFPQLRSLDLEVHKQNPPLGGECTSAGVELHLINDKN